MVLDVVETTNTQVTTFQEPNKQFEIPNEFRIALEASVCQDSLYQFVRMAWSIVEPETVYEDNWHIIAICDYLQALEEGRIPSRNLMMNVPPGHMKSLLTNVFFPAWVWTRKSDTQFLCYSYSSDLTVRDSMKCRNLVGSDWYQQRFNVRIDEKHDLKDAFNTTRGGYRVCFGMTSSIGGWRGDYILIDDPLEMSKSDSKAERDKVNNSYDSAISSRGRNPKTVKRVIIMQRLHEEDLCGHVLEKAETWEQLILPAEYDGERFVSSIGFTDPRKGIGELLWEKRFDKEYVKFQKSNLGSRGTAGQLQQRPAPISGNTFKREWFKERHDINTFAGIYISSDTASSLSDAAAKSSVVVGGLTEDYRLLPIYVWSDKVEFPQLCDKIIEIVQRYPEGKVMDIVIENKSSGIAAIQTLRQTAPDDIARKIIQFNPPASLSKEERAGVASKWCENGSVILPTPNEWLLEFEKELFDFPNGKYKDSVDAFVQLILWLENMLSDGLHYRSGA
jgi:predicted phage terminase large subunit-like protein